MTHVTKPFLPPLEEITPYLERMWDSGILSNGGPIHAELEHALGQLFGVEHVSLFCNATIALIVAQKALGIDGQIITTPYSFVATSHAIQWMNNIPVFADIDSVSLNLDPTCVEAAITETTAAIMPLHCYGNTCAVDEIKRLADRYDLKVIYDACHSFGVEDQGGSVLRYGDISVVSFHATKVFNTFEGGMVVSADAQTKAKVDHLKNFGFVSETSVVEVGINGKMSEFNAAVGLAQLRHLPEIMAARKKVDHLYRDRLRDIRGISCLQIVGQAVRNYAYFPIFVADDFALTRDELYDLLKQEGIYGRRYFFPLIPEFETYASSMPNPSASLPVACDASRRVICLPMHAELQDEEVERVCGVIQKASSMAR